MHGRLYMIKYVLFTNRQCISRNIVSRLNLIPISILQYLQNEKLISEYKFPNVYLPSLAKFCPQYRNFVASITFNLSDSNGQPNEIMW